MPAKFKNGDMVLIVHNDLSRGRSFSREITHPVAVISEIVVLPLHFDKIFSLIKLIIIKGVNFKTPTRDSYTEGGPLILKSKNSKYDSESGRIKLFPFIDIY